MERYFSSQLLKHHHRSAVLSLVVLNAGSLAAAVSLVTSLQPESKISAKRGCGLSFFGLVYFVSLFELLNMLVLFSPVGNRWRHRHKLSSGDVMDITNK